MADINVLLIEDSPDYAELVEQWLSSAGGEERFCLRWTDSLAQGLIRLAEGNVDVVLLDLGLPDSSGLATFMAIRDHHPGIPVIILSAADSESLALSTIQNGAEDYLIKGKCNADLLVRALRYAIVRHRAQLSKLGGGVAEETRVLGVIGVAGGVGATTLACNLAEELCQQTAQKVLLADLDIHGGLVSFLMGIEPKYTVLDAVNNIDRLEKSNWDGIVTQKGEGLSILASPALMGAAEVDAAVARRLLRLTRPFYRWVVLDLGPLNSFSRSVLDSAEEVFVVTTPAVPALYEAKRMIDGLVQAGLEAGRIRLVVNNRDESQTWSLQELNKMFGIPVCTSLPSAASDLHYSCVDRRLPGETTNIRKEIARLAHRVAGLPEPALKRGLSQFLSFGANSRKTDPSRQLVSKI